VIYVTIYYLNINLKKEHAIYNHYKKYKKYKKHKKYELSNFAKK